MHIQAIKTYFIANFNFTFYIGAGSMTEHLVAKGSNLKTVLSTYRPN